MENLMNLCSGHIRVQSVDKSGNIDATVTYNGNNYDHVFINNWDFNSIMSEICIRGSIKPSIYKNYELMFDPVLL